MAQINEYMGFPQVTPAVYPVCVYNSTIVLRTGILNDNGPAVSHRVKPPVLYRSPTSRGPYTYTHVGYPVERYDWTQQVKLCGSPGKFFTHSVVQFSVPYYLPSDAWPWSNILASKVKGLRTSLASDMAEYRESLGLAESVAHQLRVAVNKARELWSCRKSLSKIRRTIIRDRKIRSWQDIPAAWLGINLATNPILGTLANSIDRLGFPNSARPRVRRIHFSHIQRGTSTTAFTDQWGKPMNGRWSSVTKVTVTAYVELTLNKGVFKDNFTAGNPAEWAWELIPLSFVLDWFIPVGQYLACLDAYQGIDGVWYTVTTKATTSGVMAMRPGVTTVRSGFVIYKSYNRVAGSTAPPISIPRWSPHPSVTKLTTALSLLATSARYKDVGLTYR